MFSRCFAVSALFSQHNRFLDCEKMRKGRNGRKLLAERAGVRVACGQKSGKIWVENLNIVFRFASIVKVLQRLNELAGIQEVAGICLLKLFHVGNGYKNNRCIFIINRFFNL